MWKSNDQDPGGGPSRLSDLQDQLEQQQVLIAQLKEVIRKGEPSNLTVEKVDEYMNTLTKISGRVKHKKTGTGKRGGVETAASEKINLLRQQLEENKVKLAERGKNQKGIEEMVSQIKEQLDNSQNLINTSNLNMSISEKLDFSSNSSSEDLYNILLVKENKITDFMEKIQKLENHILDLQENLKEKDNVIDARTKAITLMTDNLSRKSKTTLDALDETREQMRQMQENFIKLEGEMKARQLKLLDDLKAKNYEIAELQEENAKLKENQTFDNPNVEKLKKQLEENNKNMIKIKAQHKNKLKELNKKIEEFKRISDINAEFVKLENENCKLQQKIAELEEEKGSLQLKLVETNSDGEKDEKIASLENDLTLLKEKLSNLSHLENVKSEITTIQFEEKLESLENERKKLIETNENLEKQIEKLIENQDLITKEKCDIQLKLDQYIQENMELIDKLEKLSTSTEKVSSAESIEIVENLTQQEKLELETYEKSITIKEEDENSQPNVDLNESVNELTEETSELLQKIELFTIERREVMDKMDVLQQENIKLKEKLKEIEHNHNILEETYEQLQNEKEQITDQLEHYKKEENSKLNTTITELENKLTKLEDLNKSYLEEKFKLLQVIEEKDESFHKKMSELKEKYLTIQEQLEKNSDSIDNIKNPLNTKIEELTMKNKEQLDKMKKIAVNLKMKTQAYQEIEIKLKESEEKLAKMQETFDNQKEEKENIIGNNFELENRNMELQNIIIDLKTKLEKNEINLQQELLLKEEMNENKYEMKLKEYELLNENQEFELKTAKDRINKLEQELGEVKEKRFINDKKLIDLEMELNGMREWNEKILQEKSEIENQLKQVELIKESNKREIEELLKENQELYENYQKMQDINNDNQRRFEEEKLKITELNNETIDKCEEKIMEMKQIIDKYELELKQLQKNFGKIQEENEELEKINNDNQRKFDELFKEKHDLQIKLDELYVEIKEKNDNLNMYEMEIEKLTKEITLKTEKVVQVEQENSDYKKQIMELEKQLLKKTAEHTIDSVLIEAKQKLAPPPIFNYQLKNDDPFNFLAGNVKIDDNSKETFDELVEDSTKTDEIVGKLKNKVKTLEFMLFNVEKEKDEALVQCNKLSEELTRLVYDREKISKVADTIESEYLSKIDSEKQEVNEETIVPKTAYLCYAKEEEEDGWGLPQDEIKSDKEEEEEDLKEKIRVLEMERTNHLEEIKQLQIKSGKLIKKLKEFKQKNEELIRNDNNLLNETIQEEFKLQIKQIEKQLNETKIELDKEKLEKQKIVKKLETLTTMNERLKETKDKQDIDILTWQRNYNDLNKKMEQFEWGQDFTEAKIEENPEINKKIIELNDIIKELTIDNEELQLLLEEQRNLRVQAEKNCNKIKENEKLQQLENDKQQLLNTIEFDKITQQNELDNLRQSNSDLEQEKLKFNEIMEKLEQEKEEIYGKVRQLEQEKEELQNEIIKLEEETKREKEEIYAKLEQEKIELVNNMQNSVEIEPELIEKLEKEKNELLNNLQEKSIREAELEKEKLEYENKIDLLINEYEIRINQRGNDVAESWKLHLELKENEFLNMEERLKKELNELEEKCNGLVNENNELRKNVDREIQNEIDKITILQQQINDRQLIINELNRNLQEKNEELDELKRNYEISQRTIYELNSQLHEMQNLKDYENENIANLQQNIIELQQILYNKNEEIVILQEEKQQQINYIKESLENDQKTLIEDYLKEINVLKEQLKANEDMQRELTLKLNEKTEEINVKIEEYKQYIDNLQHDNQQQLNYVTNSIKNENKEIINEYIKEINELKENLAGKNEEIQRVIDNLQQEKEQITESVKNEYKTIINEYIKEIDELKKNLMEKNEEIKQIMNQLQEDKEQQLLFATESIKNENKTIINEYVKEIDELRRNLAEKNKEMKQINDNLQKEKEEQLNCITESVQNENRIIINEYVKEIDELKRNLAYKNEEMRQIIDNLQEDKEQQLLYITESIRNENKTIINECINEIDRLKRNLDEKNEEIKQIIVSLQEEKEKQLNSIKESMENEMEGLKIQLENNEKQEDNEEKKQLKEIIEQQVLKIEELKLKLYDKSKDYDSIIAQLDLNQMKSQISNKEELDDDNLREPVNRAELDLALYMLHQRDVRCEELTVELTQLLEERDTLQLKLSNVIREKEEMSGRMKETDKVDDSNDDLATKLSELKTVGYKKDKTIVDEQELRRMQELSIMQQHKDVAAKLPAEAAARLVDASYTLSRDVQSPSKVILNWLWGRSTPKVNDI